MMAASVTGDFQQVHKDGSLDSMERNRQVVVDVDACDRGTRESDLLG